MYKLRLLNWDSSFFGYKVAQLDGTSLDQSVLNTILSKSIRNKISLIYWFIDPDDSISQQTAIENNYMLVDEKIILNCKIQENKYYFKDKRIVSYIGESMTDKLESLVIQSGQFSRFKKDKRIGNVKFNELYITWLKNSLSGDISDEVLVYCNKNNEVGFITIKDYGHYSTIGLLVVDKSSRGKGIGKKIVDAAFLHCLRKGIKEINVVTQKSNIEAISFYTKIGFKIINQKNIFHIWL